MLDGLIASSYLTCFFAVKLIITLDDIASSKEVDFFASIRKTPKEKINNRVQGTSVRMGVLNGDIRKCRLISGDSFENPGREEREALFFVRPDLENTTVRTSKYV